MMPTVSFFPKSCHFQRILCAFLVIFGLVFSSESRGQLVVNENATIANMTTTIQGTGVTITNMVITSGANQQLSSFANTNQVGNPLTIPNGILLSTGRGTTAIGPNASSSTSTNNGITFIDPDLTAIEPLATNDVVVLEFDVVPISDTLQLVFQFGSEEYLEYTCSQYNDAFAFFVSGPGIAGPYTNSAENFAKLPDNTPVSIGTVNQGSAGAFGNPANCVSLANAAWFDDNTGGNFIAADGVTKRLRVLGGVTPCATYHVKCVLADAGDHVWDSWVFLDGFSALGQNLAIAPTTAGNEPIEGCNSVTYLATRGGDISVPLTVNLSYSGTATNGVDYTGAPTTLTFPAGVTTQMFTIVPVQDGVIEPTESVIITANWNVCTTALTGSWNFPIKERTATLSCNGNMTLNATPGTCGRVVNWTPLNATTNCGTINITQTSGLPSGSVFPVGTTTVSFLATPDGSGSVPTATCSFTVTVLDTETPTIACPPNQVLMLGSSCTAVVPDYRPLATATDNCSIASLIQSPAPGTVLSGLGTTTIGISATDPSGNTTNCSFTVTRQDNTPPVITCPGAQTVALNGSCTRSLSDYRSLATRSDNCTATSSIIVTQSPPSGSVLTGVGTTVVTLTATDASGNVSTCTFDVNRVDTSNPTISCSGNQTLVLNGSCSGVVPDYRSLVTTTDNCTATGSISITQSPAPGTTVSGTGSTTINMVVTDASGNTNNCNFNMNRVDNTPPVISCLSNQTISVNATCQITVPDFRLLAAVSDNCTAVGSINYTQSPNPGSTINNAGTTNVTLTATDASGNTSTCTFTVTRVDNTPPNLTCPGTQTLALNSSCAGSLGDYRSLATRSDNCTTNSSIVVSQSPAAGTAVSGIGTTVVTLTVTDLAGNVSNCTFNVNRVDNTAPTITCPATQTVVLNSSCAGVLGDYTALATVADNCTATGSLTVTQSPIPGTSVSGTGTTSVTLTVTDASGNTNSCNFNVTRVDNTPPSITCPSDRTINLISTCTAVLPNYRTLAVVSDNCTATASINITQSPAQGSTVSGAGTIVITLTATDASGNSFNCTFNLTKLDVTAPTITCPVAQTLVLGSSCTASLGDYRSLATVADNCTPAGSLTITQSPIPGTSVSGVGTTSVTLTVTDASGNSSNCSFNVNRVDNTAPVITCPGAQSLNVNATCNATIADYRSLATVTDNCSATAAIVITQSPVAGTVIPGLAATVVTLTATDASGNTSNCTFNVNKTDNIAPTLTCPGNQTVPSAGACTGTLGNYVGLATATDNCTAAASITKTQSPASGTAINAATTVTITATDANGNSSTCTFIVTPVDLALPTISCPGAQTLNLNATCGGFVPNYTSLATVSDNCTPMASIVVTQSPVAGTPVSGVGSTTITLTATDAAGNASNCTFTMNRVDNTPPSVTCPAAQTLVLNATCAGVLPDYRSLATISDNCTATGSLVVTQVPAVGAPVSGVGTTSVTITVTDAAGNSSNCSFNVNRVDTTLPTITCPAAQTLVLSASCAGVLGDYRSLATIADNCTATGSLLVTQVPAPGSAVSGVGTTSVTLTVTDASGNSSNCSFNVNRVDTTLPTITCPAAQTLSLGAGCTALLPDYSSMATVADNCGIPVVTQSPAAGAPVSGIGTTSVTLTVTDASGNSANCSFNVNRVDNTAPVVTCPGNQTVPSAGACAGTLGNYVGLVTATDNCTAAASIVISQSPAAGTAITAATTVTVTGTDASGNSSTCTFIVTPVDLAAPTIACPGAQTLNLNATCGGFVPNYTSLATVSDNCTPTASIVVTQSPVAGTPVSGVGSITITLTATDAAGNASNCTFTMNRVDNTAPSVTCPAAQTLVLNATCAGLLPDYRSLATISDNCTATASLVVTQVPAVGAPVSGVGITVVTITVTDAAGNSSNCSFNVNRVDTTLPTIACPAAQTLVLNATCAGVLGDYRALATIADNCTAAGSLVVTQLPAPGSAVSGVGTTSVTLTVTDASGNSSNCSFNVNRVDTTLPTITCPAAQTLSIGAGCAATLPDYTSMATVADNCTAAGALVVTQAPAIGTPVSGVGITVVTLTVTDASGNSANCSFNVNRVDNTAPVVTCPGNQTVPSAGACAGTLGNYVGLVTATDNCTAAASIVISQSPAAGTAITAATTVTVTGTDASGNSSTCTFIVTPVDLAAPTIACPGAQTLNLNATCGGLVPNYTSLATVSDNCTPTASIVVTQSPVAGTPVSGVGSTTITLTATDAAGNTSNCTFTMNRVDNTAPSVTCPAAQTLVLNATCAGVLPDYRSLATISDNCTATGSLVVTQVPAVGAPVSGVGTTSVTITVTDAAGNSSNCSFNVNRVDTTLPTITCPAAQTLVLSASCAGVLGDYRSLATIADNCTATGSLVVTQVPAPGSAVSGVGTTSVTLTVTDASGNSANCSFNVNRVDNILPTITCPAAQTLSLGAGCASTLPDYTSMATVADNCTAAGAIVVTQAPAIGSAVSGVGITVITLTVTDASGNSANCSFNVNRVDNTAPVVTCPGNQTVPSAGACTGTLGNYVGLVTATDNCTAVASIVISQSPAAGTAITAATTVTVTGTDASGNSSTCTFIVTPVDLAAPTIACPGAQTLNLDATCSGVVPNYTSLATVSDNCTPTASIVVTQSPMAGTTVSGVGSSTITLTATDAAGNTSNCTFTMNRVDTTAPSVTCPAAQTLVLNATCAGLLPDYRSLATISDNCTATASLVVTQVPAVGATVSGVGITVVTITVTDAAGNSSNCSFNANRVDTTLPTIACPAAQTLVLNATCAGVLGDYRALATIADNCTAAGALVVTQLPAPGTPVSGVGTTSVTLTVTDASGNSANCSFNVNRVDTTLPTITCPAAQTLSLGAGCIATLPDYTSMATVADNCGTPVVIQSPAAGTSVSGVGVTSVTLTITDASGNSANCSFNVNRVDNTAPVVTCPGNQTVPSAGACAGTLGNYVGLATATDNCTAAGAIVISQSPVAGTSITSATTVIITATDANGNISTCTFIVTPVDIAAPNITCPGAQTLNLDATCSGVVPNYTSLATVSDNCTPTASIVVTQSPVAGTPVSGVGSTTITLTATDAAGNTSNCTFTMNRVDNTAPSVTCPAAQTLVLNATCAGLLPDYRSLATISDNCTATASLVVTQVPAVGAAVSGVGITVVTITVTDAAGNSSNCSFNVNRVDTTLPTITCPAAQTLVLSASCAGVLADYRALATIADNCTAAGALVVTQVPAPGTPVSGVGTTSVTLTVTDASGNSANCSFNVNRVDTTLPTITCPAAQTLSLGAGCTATLPDYTSMATVADNCTAAGALVVTQAPAIGSAVSGVGITVITLTVTDASGNSANCSFNINRVDNTAPVVTCPGNQSVSVNASCGFILPDYRSMVSATDGCTASGSIVLTQSPAPNSTVTGNTTITITATDASGNTGSCTFVVTVADNTPPVIANCPINQAVSFSASCDYTLLNYISTMSITATDNCDNNVTLTQNPIAGTVITTNQVVTITATDDAGNSTVCTFDVTPADNTAPNISGCPSTQTVSFNTSCGFVVPNYVSLSGVTINDNCDPNPLVDQTPSAGTIITTPTLITIQAWDNESNSSVCAFTITPIDNTAPTITNCPANQTVSANTTCQFVMQDYTSSVVTSDNCDSNVTLTQSPAANSTVNGTTTVTITATDDAGNTSTCTFQVIVNDNTPPSLSNCPANFNANLNSSCNYTLPNFTGVITVADNCDNSVTITQSPAAGTIFSNHGTVVPVLITATDDNGNSTTCSFNITLRDNTNPTVICPANLTRNANPGVCYATITIPAPVAADNCSGVSVVNNITGTNNASGDYPIGTTIITWTATDLAGNTAVCNQTIIVNDNQLPAISCPVNITVNANAGTCTATPVALGVPVTSDNCGIASVTNNAPVVYPLGLTNVIWTVTDVNGNINTCTQTVNVTDNQNPTITCGAPVSVFAAAGLCTANVVVPGPTTADNCSVASVVNNHNNTNNASGIYPVGTTTVIWTVTDGSGNIATCSQVITVTDNQAPVITCPANINAGTDNGLCSANLLIPSPATSDNCGVLSVTNSIDGDNNASGIYTIGTTSITWIVTDIHGNISTCTQTVIVSDDEDPTVTCPGDQTVSANSTCQFVMLDYTSLVSGSDNCDLSLDITQSPAVGTTVSGTTTVTITATDDYGNASTCSFDVIVNDTDAPVITACATDRTEQLGAACTFALPNYTGLIIAIDNCDLSLTYTQLPAPGTVVSTHGTAVTITITVSDDNGNSSNCTFDVTLNDSIDPTITCPANLTQNADPGQCNANVTIVAPATADNCAVATVVNSITGTNNASGNYPIGSTTILWTVTDVAGNTATCNQIVTIVDNQFPQITCPANITVNADAGVCNAVIAVPVPVTSDNCNVVSVTNNYNNTGNASDTYPVGSTTVIWTVLDDHGHSTTCNMTITVVDNQIPAITCPANISVFNTPGACNKNIIVPAPVVSDNCAILSVTNNITGTSNASGVYAVGITTVIWTVTDVSGNTNTCSQDIEVIDNQIPTITCPANITIGTDAGTCDASVTVPQPTVGDNCAVLSFTNSLDGDANASGTYPKGLTNIVWTVTDIHGNTNTCSMMVTVLDDEDPILTCPGNQLVDFSATCNFTLPDYTSMVGVTDNCDVLVPLTQSPVAGTVITSSAVITITGIDSSGNTASCAFAVIPNDNIAPTIINCPANISVAFTDDCDYTLHNYITEFSVSATDNCDASVTIVQSPPANTVIVGNTIIEITATDDAGNITTCTFEVTPSDQTAPYIYNCPSSLSETVNSSCGFTIPDYISQYGVYTSDNCDANPLVYQDPSPGTIITTPTTIVIYAIDSESNISACGFTVTPVDNSVPVITTCVTDQIVTADATCQFALADYTALIVASDNCDSSLDITQDPIAGQLVAGTTTITITVMDDTGNISICTFDVIVEDTTVPTIVSCAPAVTESVNSVCEFILPDYTSQVVANDNCDMNLTYTQLPAPGTVFSGHGTVVPVTISITDDSNNATDCTFDVTLEDVINPTIICPSNINVNTDAGVCEATVAIPQPTVSDNCFVASLTNDYNNTNNASGIYPEGTTTIVWTVTDLNGNSASCTMTVTVNDNESPLITCPSDIMVSNEVGVCNATIVVPAITANDNCGILSITNSYNNTSDASDNYPVGTHNITWTVTDIHNNVSTCVQQIIVNDDEVPTITCPASIVQDNDTGNCTAFVVVPIPVTADNCAVLSVVNNRTNTSNASGVYPVGLTTIEWTVTDIYGNIAQCTMTVEVVDSETPSITCPSNITVNNDNGSCGAVVTVPVPVSDDNCGVNTVVNNYTGATNASAYYPEGTTTVTWTVTDIHGNINTCSIQVTVIDNEDPIVSCPSNISVLNDPGVCSAMVTIGAPTVSDNCGIASVVNNYNNSADATDVYPVGLTNILWTITDIHGNVSTCSMSVTVQDPELPVITCPSDTTVFNDGGVCEAFINIASPVTSDNCAVASVTNDYNNTANATDTYPVGTTTVTWTVTDLYGNSATCVQTIVVIDNEAPVITCMNDITVNNDNGNCTAFVTLSNPVSTDNCAIASIVNDYNGTNNASDVYNVGQTTVTWTVTDIHGNISTCSNVVTVEDNEAPVVTCPSNISVFNDAGVCEAFVTMPLPVVSDNCAISTITNDYNSTNDGTDTYVVGVTNVEWTITDIHGNVTMCTMSVTVIDNENPVVVCPNDTTVNNDAGVCNAFINIANPFASDNCTIATVTNDYNNTPDATDTYPVGTTTVIWTITDIYGNNSTCAHTVVVLDNELPIVTCPNAITQDSDPSVCEANVLVDLPVVSDNCGIASIVNDWTSAANASAVYPVGTTTVTWTITDIHGNINMCSTNITINDVEQPFVTCPSDISVNTDSGVCEASLVVPVPVISDNCAVATVINDYNNTADASGIYQEGTTTVTWTITDIHGNISTCSTTIVVTDNEAPVVTCPLDIVQINDNGSCDAMVSIDSVVVSDNCGILSVVNDYNNTSDASDVYNVGTTTIIWTITDIHGNITTCTQTITIEDPEAPTIICPSDIVVTNDATFCGAQVLVPMPQVDDNCSVASVVNDYNNTADASDYYNEGVTTITWTVTDIYGNATSCTMMVTVNDIEAPVVTCPSDIEVNNDPGQCSALVTVPQPAVSDNCAIATIVNDYNNTDNATDIYSEGETTILWTITDIHGNVTTCDMRITVVDNEIPSITCPIDIVVENDTTLCEAFVTVPLPVNSDNCGVATIVNDYTQTSDASAVYEVGTTLVTWTITDIHGNVNTCTMSITVNDTELPTLVCPDNMSLSNDVGLCSALVTIPVPVVADNCQVQSILNDFNNTNNASGIYPVGSTDVIWTLTDIHGNVSTCTMSIVVDDVELPMITCPENIEVSNDEGLCSAMITVPAPSVSDNCEVLSVTNNINGTTDASGVYPTGFTTVTWTITDIHGNTTICDQMISVVDNENPIADNCGYIVNSFNDPGECGALVTYDIPMATDNCGLADTTLIVGFNSGEFFPVGTTEVIYEFTDLSGNTVQCNFYVVVIDNELPAPVCNDDVTLNNDPGVCGAMVTYTAPSFVDNCGTANGSSVLVSGLESGSVFPVGTTEVVYNMIDGTGNISACTFNVTVIDNELPTIVCPGDTVVVDPILNYSLPITTDNCSSTLTLIEGLEPGDVFPHGFTTVTYVATDPAGNADTCSFQVLVNTPPVAVNDGTDFLEEDTSVTIDIYGNDYDPDGDSITITLILPGIGGEAVLNDDGTMTYSVDPREWCGIDSVGYILCDTYGACDTGWVVFNVECYLFVIIPEGISPNGDGVNDVFEIIGIVDYPNSHLTIYNRWGHRVFERKQYANDWDGRSESSLTLGNGLLPKGTYFYVLDLGIGEKPIKGYVYLNR